MKGYYDPSKWVRKPEIAENIKKHGYTVIVYTDETETEILEQRFVSPEEVAEQIAMRDAVWKKPQSYEESGLAVNQV